MTVATNTLHTMTFPLNDTALANQATNVQFHYAVALLAVTSAFIYFYIYRSQPISVRVAQSVSAAALPSQPLVWPVEYEECGQIVEHEERGQTVRQMSMWEAKYTDSAEDTALINQAGGFPLNSSAEWIIPRLSTSFLGKMYTMCDPYASRDFMKKLYIEYKKRSSRVDRL